MGGLAICLVTFLARNQRTNPNNIRSIEPQLKAFFAAKEQQARQFAKEDGTNVPPEVWKYFAAATTGNWDEVARLYFRIADRSYHFAASDWGERLPTPVRQAIDKVLPDLAAKRQHERLETPVWQTVNETYRAYEQLAAANPKFALAFGHEVIDSIRPGSIYFGGSDAGRFIITFLIKSPESGNPFFVLSQNALADGFYLDYVRPMSAEGIRIPDASDYSKAWDDYLAEAKRRLVLRQLKPGEQIEMVGGRANVSGNIWLTEINAKLAKSIFDNNSQREFFLDEGYGMDWTYPHLVPHGLIFKINREPLVELDQESIQRDRAYWIESVSKLIGNWLTEPTTIPVICAFAEKVYLRKDLSEFKGEREFAQTARTWASLPDFLGAAAVLSRSRAKIARLYYWRAQNAKSVEEQERMLKEMDFAVRQAIALCPYQQDAVYWCVTSLAARKRWNDAFLVLNTAERFYPKDKRFGDWVRPLRDWIQQQAFPDKLSLQRYMPNFTPSNQASP